MLKRNYKKKKKKFQRGRERERKKRKVPVFADGGTTNEVEEVEKGEDHAENVVFEGQDCRFPLLALRPVV